MDEGGNMNQTQTGQPLCSKTGQLYLLPTDLTPKAAKASKGLVTVVVPIGNRAGASLLTYTANASVAVPIFTAASFP